MYVLPAGAFSKLHVIENVVCPRTHEIIAILYMNSHRNVKGRNVLFKEKKTFMAQIF